MIKPILFNTEMVKAIMAGRKTQTRRIIKPQPTNPRWNNIGWFDWDDGHGYRMKPPCESGDILWVREAWSEMPYGIVYRADNEKPEGWDADDLWYPSIHMPKEAARIFLKVNDVRAERLHEITQQQAIAEGIPSRICKVLGFKYKDNEGVEHDQSGIEMCIADFAKIWDSTIKPADIDTYGWNANPWVWVIEFELCEKPEGWPNA